MATSVFFNWRLWQLFFAPFLLCLATTVLCRELLSKNTDGQLNSNQLPIETEGPNGEEGASCTLEFQIIKKLPGTCIKLGRSIKGCTAGNYLHPLHPDCK